MLRNVFGKTLRDQRRALLGWSVGILLLVVVEAALWPSIRDMPDLKEFLANYPEAIRKLLNMEDFGTGTGFMNAELFSAMLPLLFIIFGVSRGARAIAGEEEKGTLDILLVTPVSAVRLVLENAAALAVTMFALGAVLYAGVLGSSAVFGMGIGPVDLAGATLAMVLLGIEFGWLALALGAVLGRRGLAIGITAAVAVAAYFLHVAGQLVDAMKPWQPISPFYQALSGGPLAAGWPVAYAWMAVAAVVFVVASLPLFDRRDITTH